MKEFSVYKNKKVLITGHTGFKGSWLTLWLKHLGANIIGYSLEPPFENSIYEHANISDKIIDYRKDIRNLDDLHFVFEKEKPEIVFHLAAQAIVIDSYNEPVYTYETNTMGTVNVLEAIRRSETVNTGIFITTDKVYQNKEWIWPYRETEPMGGFDPYSSSKGAAELIIASYRNSFFSQNDSKYKKSIASVRAGNVIGGGDWAKNRIIPDCIRAIENGKTIEVRNPKAIRPWQHVLEPLGGYLLLGAKMMLEPGKYTEGWNFGPESENVIDVQHLVEKLIEIYQKGSWKDISNPTNLHEANFLSLDINKAKYQLQWNPVLSFNETMQLTIDWYKNYKQKNVFDICKKQISYYQEKLKFRK